MSENPAQSQKTLDKALVFLKIRPHLSAELKKKLQMRKFDPDLIDDSDLE